MQTIEMAHMMMQAQAVHQFNPHHQYMHQMPAQPARYVLTFGKHIGKPLSEVTEEYKEWLVFHKFHLRRPDLYEALDQDGYFRPKPKPTPPRRDVLTPPLNCEASHKRPREDDCVQQESALKAARVHTGPVADEVAQWCRSNSDDIDGWDNTQGDDFIGLFNKEGGLNVEESNDTAFDAVLMLEDGTSPDFDPAGVESFEDDSVATTPCDDEEASRAETPSTSEAQAPAAAEGNKINEGFELQACLVDAFQAFERGECRRALKLLRSSIHKVIQLEATLTEQERACMQETLVTVVHAARMIACKFRDEQNKNLIEKGDHYRRAGLFEVAVLMYAEAVDLSSSN